jgi:hypothetical protein
VKQFIIVTNQEMVEKLEKMGFFSCGSRDIGNGIVATQFLLTDKLHKALKDKQKFSKKHYAVDSKLTF